MSEKVSKLSKRISDAQRELTEIQESDRRAQFKNDGLATKLTMNLIRAQQVGDIREAIKISDKLSLYLKNAISRKMLKPSEVTADPKHDAGLILPERLRLRTAIPTGVPVFVGGYAGKGKTTFGVNVAHSLIRENQKVLILSYEMRQRQILNRLIATEWFWERGESLDWPAAYKVLRSEEGKIARRKWDDLLHIQERHPGEEITAKSCIQFLEWYITRHGAPSLVVVDYMQLIDDGDIKARNPLDVTIRTFTEYLKGTDTHMVGLAQDNRESYKSSGDRAPDITAFGGSSRFDTDGGALVTLGRTYGPRDYDIMEIRTVKNRFGPISTVWMKVDKKSGAFAGETSFEEVKSWKQKKSGVVQQGQEFSEKSSEKSTPESPL